MVKGNKQIKLHASYVSEIAYIYGGQFEVTGTYDKAKTKIAHTCTRCGFVLVEKPNSLLSGKMTCPGCKHANDPQDLIQLKRMGHSLLAAVTIAYPSLTFTSVGRGVGDKATFSCNVCGLDQVRNLITLKRSPCIGCGKLEKSRKLRDSHADYVARIRQIWGTKVQVVGSYISTKRKVRHKCMECFNTWKVSPLNSLHRGSGCPYCANRAKRGHLNKGAKVTEYTLGGRVVKVQGYEPAALDYLVAFFEPSDIRVEYDGDVPVVEYNVRKRRHRYFPDMYVRSSNTIIEVKSMYTLGFGSSKLCRKFWKLNCLKALACKANGFKFALLLMDSKGNRLRLPKNWPTLPKEVVASELARLNDIKQPKV